MGVLVGIENMEEAIKKTADGGPHVMTMHKCVARQYFRSHATKVYLATKSRTFSSYHPNRDVPKAEVDEVQRLGG
jgi:DhnA family fructose-bisphosphate aldolase class Ia